ERKRDAAGRRLDRGCVEPEERSARPGKNPSPGARTRRCFSSLQRVARASNGVVKISAAGFYASPPLPRRMRPIEGVITYLAVPAKSLVCLICVAAGLAAAQSNETQETVDVIVARMMAVVQKCKGRDPGFAVRRDYQLFDKKWESKAQVV